MKTNHLLSLVTAAACALLLCQCATNRVPQLNPGEAYFNASPEQKHRGQLKGMQVVSVNGKKEGGRATRIPSGPVDLVVAFHWPKVGKTQVPLSFRARGGHAYFVKYDRYPNPGSSSRGLGSVSKGLIMTGANLNLAGAPLMFAGIGTSFIESVGKGLGLKTRSTKAANFIDLFVISNISSEGVVQQVRAYPSGRVHKR